jgi:hypothetical protein
MDGDMTKQEKRARLIATYRKINPDQRHVLDQTVRDLAALPALPGLKAPPKEVRRKAIRSGKDEAAIN